MVLLEQIAIFLLEGLRAMMLLLVVYVTYQLLQLAPAYREAAVAPCQKNALYCLPWRLIQAEEVFLIFSRRSAWLMVRASLAAMWT
jgi:hypothetical protein